MALREIKATDPRPRLLRQEAVHTTSMSLLRHHMRMLSGATTRFRHTSRLLYCDRLSKAAFAQRQATTAETALRSIRPKKAFIYQETRGAFFFITALAERCCIAHSVSLNDTRLRGYDLTIRTGTGLHLKTLLLLYSSGKAFFGLRLSGLCTT